MRNRYQHKSQPAEVLCTSWGEPSYDPEELAQMRWELEITEVKLGILQMEITLDELKKYNPSQPRVPAGNRFGGRWTSGGDTGGPSKPRSTGKKPKEKPALKLPKQPELAPKVPQVGRVGNDSGSTQVAESGEIVSDGVVSDDFVPQRQRAPRSQRTLPEIGDKIEVPNENGEVPDTVNIFIGGAKDYEEGHNVRGSDNLHYDAYGANYYFAHDKADDVEKLVDELNKQGIKPNLIGHSLGGGTAAQIALAKAGRVNNLITVDPVGPMRLGKDPRTKVRIYDYPKTSDYAKIKENVSTWININAEERPGHENNFDNWIARQGGKWKHDPEGTADVFIRAPLDHAEFDAMLKTPAEDGLTAQRLLNYGYW